MRYVGFTSAINVIARRYYGNQPFEQKARLAFCQSLFFLAKGFLQKIDYWLRG